MTNLRSFLNDQSKDRIFRRRTECEDTHLTGRPIRRSVSEAIIKFQNCLSRFLSFEMEKLTVSTRISSSRNENVIS